MSLKEIRGNEATIKRLMETVKNQTVSHAYIFEGAALLDKKKLAQNFVKAILCTENEEDACDACHSCLKIEHGNHEDVFYIKAEGSSIKDEAILEMQRRLANRPYEGLRNIVMMENADLMTPRAQNRLLKTLEEPAPGTVIILLSENVENLVQTVLSRCIIFRLHTVGTEELLQTREYAEKIGQMIMENAPFYQISEEISPILQRNEDAYGFLDALQGWFRDVLVSLYDSDGRLLIQPSSIKKLKEQGRAYKRDRIYRGMEVIEDARRDLNRNINVAYAIKGMILKI